MFSLLNEIIQPYFDPIRNSTVRPLNCSYFAKLKTFLVFAPKKPMFCGPIAVCHVFFKFKTVKNPFLTTFKFIENRLESKPQKTHPAEFHRHQSFTLLHHQSFNVLFFHGALVHFLDEHFFVLYFREILSAQ